MSLKEAITQLVSEIAADVKCNRVYVEFSDFDSLIQTQKILNVGEYLHVSDGGHTYKVAEEDAVDHHLTTNEGVKLYVLPGASGDVSIDQFGAVGVDSGTPPDSTAAIQAALEYASRGRRVVMPARRYGISSTVNFRAYTVFEGVPGEPDIGSGTVATGSTFVWLGGNNSICLRMFGLRRTKISGFVIDANGATGLTGILLDSDNLPSGSQNEISHFHLNNCLVGVQWGTSGLSGGAYANDGTKFHTFTIWSSEPLSRGFVLNSGNAGQMSEISDGGIQVEEWCVDIEVANVLQLKKVFGGGRCRGGFVRSAYGQSITLIGCASECWGASSDTLSDWRHDDAYFFRQVEPPEGASVTDTFTTTLTGNQILNPVRLDHACRVVSHGNSFGQCRSSVDDSDVLVTAYGIADFSRVSSINDGVITGSIDLTTGEPVHGWIASQYLGLSVDRPGHGWISPAFDAGNFTASGGMQWFVDQADVQTYAYNQIDRQMTVAFNLNATSVQSASHYILNIAIPNGRTATKDMSTIVRANNGSDSIALAYVSAGGTQIQLQPISLAAWNLVTNSLTIQGQITFEVDW